VRPSSIISSAVAMLAVLVAFSVSARAETGPGGLQVDDHSVLVRSLPRSPHFRSQANGSAGEWVPVAIGPDESPTAAADRLSRIPGLEVAYNVVYHELATGDPNDPYFDRQWNMRRVGVPDAWSYGRGNGVTVAVLDSGIGTGGEDLTCRTFVAPYNAFTDGTTLADVVDDDGHGTHVTGTIAQCTDNGVGVAGLAPEVRIMPVKVLTGGTGKSLVVAAGIQWAVDHGADVINLSLGSSCAADWPTCRDPVLDDAIDTAVAAGVTVVVAAGNDGAGYVGTPANSPNAIAVGATRADDTVATYSSGGTDLDLVAPGGNSGDVDGNGYPDGILQETVNGGVWAYYWYTGTSMASPHVAATAALLAAAAPTLTPAEIAAVIENTATDLGTPGWDPESGAGLLRTDAAIDATVHQAAIASFGGQAVVGDAVLQEADAVEPSVPVRIYGTDRYATAAAVASYAFSPGVPVVYVATGADFPDALAVAPIAARRGGPVLLVNGASIPRATRDALSRLAPGEIVVVGGAAVVPDSVLSALAPYTTGSVTRVAGADRYRTAIEVSRSYFADGAADVVYLATGENFPDALSAGVAGAVRNGPVLLTPSTRTIGAVNDEIRRLAPAEVVLVGGTGAISPAVEASVAALGFPVRRLAGATRYATSALVSADAFPSPSHAAFLATGENFPDALAGVPAAFARGGPVLLTTPNDIPGVVAGELRRLFS